MEGRTKTRIFFGLLATALVVADAAILADLASQMPLGADFAVFREAAIRQGPSIYPGDPSMPFVNPPSSLWLFEGLKWLPLKAGLFLWSLAGVASFVAGMRRHFSTPVVVLSLLSPIVPWTLWLGQSTLLLAGIAAIGVSASAAVGGLLIAVVLTVKPQMLWLLPAALWVRGDRQKAAWSIAFAIVIVGLSWLLLGTQAWVDWYGSLPAFRDVLLERDILSHSPSLLAWMALSSPWTVGLGIALAVASLFVFRRTMALGEGAAFGLACGASALAAPYALPHDLVTMLPLVVRDSIGRTSIGRRAAAAAIFVALFLPVAVPLYLVLIAASASQVKRKAEESKTPGPDDPGVLA